MLPIGVTCHAGYLRSITAVRRAVLKSAFPDFSTYIKAAQNLGLVVLVNRDLETWAIADSILDLMDEYSAAPVLVEAISARLQEAAANVE